jgi:transcriptional regulator of acetoin/glycerol metabolism
MITFPEPLPTVHQLQKAILVAALRQTKGNMQAAAPILGLSLKTVYNWCGMYKVEYAQFR